MSMSYICCSLKTRYMPLALWVKGRAFQSPGVEEDLEDNCQDLLVS